MMNLWNWLVANYVQLVELLLSIGVVLESAVRIWPTESGKGFATRFGEYVDKLAEILKVPNNVKKP